MTPQTLLSLSPVTRLALFGVPTLALALTSCGGGTTQDTSAAVVPAAPVAVQATNTRMTTTALPLSSVENALLSATNAARAKGYTCAATAQEKSKYFAPAAALTWSSELAQAARDYANNMATYNFFDHTNDGGKYGPADFTVRVQAAGYTHWTQLGENLAAMSDAYTTQEVVQAWLESTDGHCQTLMAPELTEIGIGTARGSNNVTYWVQEFGSRK